MHVSHSVQPCRCGGGGGGGGDGGGGDICNDVP